MQKKGMSEKMLGVLQTFYMGHRSTTKKEQRNLHFKLILTDLNSHIFSISALLLFSKRTCQGFVIGDHSCCCCCYCHLVEKLQY